MTTGRLDSIFRYPVKGLPGQILETIAVAAGRPIPHDRQYAVCNGDISFEKDRPHWVRRSNFLQVASNAAMVTVAAEHRPEESYLRLSRNGEEIFAGDLRAPAEAKRLEALLAELVGGDELRGEPRLVAMTGNPAAGKEGQAFADTPQPHISIINLATVRSLGKMVDADLDPRRFRGNLYVEAEPWSEFDWVGKKIAVGGVHLDVVSRIGRCAATNVNPETGERDQNLPLALRRKLGHADCGVYALAAEPGELVTGATIVVA